MANLVECEIRWDAGHKCWRFTGAAFNMSANPGTTKVDFIKEVVSVLHKAVDDKIAAGYTLRICNKAGRYVEERTIPRSADPKRSKG